MRPACCALLVLGYVNQAAWAALPTALRLSSTEKDATIRESMGEYEEAGIAHGAPMYKRLSISLPQAGDRWLFRAPSGRWSITVSETGVEANKKVLVMSSSQSASPLGQQYRFYSGAGEWKADESLRLTDISFELAKRKRQHEEYAQAAAKARQDAEALRALEAQQQAVLAQAALERRAKEARAGELAAAQRASADQARADGEAAEKDAVERSLVKVRQQRIDEILAEKAARKEAKRLAEEQRLNEERLVKVEEEMAREEEIRLAEYHEEQRLKAEAELERERQRLIDEAREREAMLAKQREEDAERARKLAAEEALRIAALEEAAHAAAAEEAEKLRHEALRLEEAVREKTAAAKAAAEYAKDLTAKRSAAAHVVLPNDGSISTAASNRNPRTETYPISKQCHHSGSSPSALTVTGGAAAATKAVRGEYRRKGSTHGYPLYQRGATGSDLMFLFRTVHGKWSFASTPSKVAKSKGQVVSAVNADRPFEVEYRYLETAGKWPKDSSLHVRDASPCLEGDDDDEEEPDL